MAEALFWLNYFSRILAKIEQCRDEHGKLKSQGLIEKRAQGRLTRV